MTNSRWKEARWRGDGGWDFILTHHCLSCQKHADRQNMLIGTATSVHTHTHTHAETIKKSSGDSRLILYLHRSIENWNPQPQIRHQSSSVGCVNKSDYGQNHFPFTIVLSAHSMPQHQITREGKKKSAVARWRLISASARRQQACSRWNEVFVAAEIQDARRRKRKCTNLATTLLCGICVL